MVVKIVDSMGKNPSNGGLPCAAWTDEKIGMTDFALLEGVLESTGNLFLPDDVLELSGAILAVKNFTAHYYSAASTAAQAAWSLLAGMIAETWLPSRK